MSEVKIFKKDKTDKVLIVGSDGLWEKMTEGYFVTTSQKFYTKKGGAEKICKELVLSAAKKWDKVGKA